MRSNKIALGGIAAALTLASGIADANAQNTLTFGAIVPSSGPFAEWGRTNSVALTMLEKQINDAGGVNGKKIKIVNLHDAAKPAQAANDLRKLASDEKALAVAGPLTSSAAEV